MRLSSIDRLLSMPDIFTIGTFIKISGLDAKSAEVYLSRWSSSGAISATGKKSGTYYNLVKNRNASNDLLSQAILSEYPSAVLMGESVLHSAGWVTQIPASVSVAVIKRRSYQSIDNAEIYGRSIHWFQLMHEYFIHPNEAEFSTYGLKSLSPAYSLADLCKYNDGWIPDPDDLDISDQDWLDFKKSIEMLKAPLPEKYVTAVSNAVNRENKKTKPKLPKFQ